MTDTVVDPAAEHIQKAMELLGMDFDDENFRGTPERFVKYLMEYTRPYDPEKVLKIGFESEQAHNHEYKGLVVQSGIPFRTICPHHLLPVFGQCHIGYLPDSRVVGLSKLTRLVDAVGHAMPRMQETITDILADTLMEYLKARGAIVVVSAEHGCMTGRGVEVHNVPTTTSTIRGLFRDVPAAREEFFELLRLSRK